MKRFLAVFLLVILAAVASFSTHAPAGALSPVTFSPSETSPAIVAENNLPGTAAWHLGKPVPGQYVEGFLNQDSVKLGDSASFFVNTNAPSYTVAAYRMGWYHKFGGRLIWTSGTIAGRVQPKCLFTPGINMTSCTNWTAGGSFTITSDFVPGDYVLKLTSSTGATSYMLLTVWDPTSTATYLLIGRTMTDEGWNTYGGYDFYGGLGACPEGSATYPPCNRARVASLDRPYATGRGASDYFGNEFPLVFYMESQGLDVTYATDVTLTEHPAFESQHKAILSLGHDETWSYQERQGAVAAFHKGVNLVFFGSAAVLRHARMQNSALGVDREVVNYRDSAADPLWGKGSIYDVTGNTFSAGPTHLPPSQLTGELYSGYTRVGALYNYVVADAASWLYDGLKISNGYVIPGVVTSDFDHVSYSGGTPANFHVLGHSPIPAGQVTTGQGTWNGLTYSDAGYFTDPTSKAGSFNAGTVNWIYTITQCDAFACPKHVMSVMTGNLLRVFGEGPVGLRYPSVGTRATIAPFGS